MIAQRAARPPHPATVVQPKVGFEYEIGDILTRRAGWFSWYGHAKGSVLYKGTGYSLTTDEIVVDGERQTQLEVIIDPIDETSDNEVQNLLDVTVPDLVQNLNRIVAAAHGQWVRTWNKNIFGWWGSSSDQVKVNDRNLSGQFQMTAGLTLGDLADVISGERGDGFVRSPTGTLLNYSAAANDEIAARWARARAVVNNHNVMGLLGGPKRRQLTAVVVLLASIPVSIRQARLEYPKVASKYLLARTDFATIIAQLPLAVRQRLDAATLRRLVIDTVSSILNVNNIDAQSPVFTNNFSDPQVPDLTNLTIGDWINALFERPGTYWGTYAAKDLLTKKNFPGTTAQKGWLESLGALGGKMDPGRKPIFELRGLRVVMLNDLRGAIQEAILYLRNAPQNGWGA